MNIREFRRRIADILARQREERLETLRNEAFSEKKPVATETRKPKTKRRTAS